MWRGIEGKKGVRNKDPCCWMNGAHQRSFSTNHLWIFFFFSFSLFHPTIFPQDRCIIWKWRVWGEEKMQSLGLSLNSPWCSIYRSRRRKKKLGGKKTYEKDQFLAGVVCARNTRVIPQRESRIKCDYMGTSLFIFICITPALLIPRDPLMFSFQIAKSWNGICYF